MDSIERIRKIMALIEIHPEGLSGRDLADACGVPWGTMKQDLRLMASSIETPFPLYTDRDEESEDEKELFQPHVKWFMASAEKRYTPVHLNVREGLTILRIIDFLQEDNSFKDRLRQKILSGFDFGEEESYRYIKGELSPIEPLQGQTFTLIEKAVRNTKRIRIFFNERKIIVDPLGIVYYSRLRYWYLVARERDVTKTYRLNNIQEVDETSESFQYPDGFSLKAWLGPRWGMEYGDLLPVKVRFLNRSQTLAKVRKDVAHRDSKLTLLEDGSLLFQDEIIGVNEFITWILGFGSAAQILEPVELRSLILEKIRETLKNYRDRL
ncbi:hypothetical protein Desor_0718 [Desulfosporosinus orientis DSM 765]|uniref:Uncharacterized protein n=1 Tax=Desulfosporosinus orientis (strain ATCC 19365 / DSM 765 / NCIMB 8382 / VKM B-1628 / Singapore I) TaxID=768706 RepID=G7W7Y1_DESOD|nr:WYL domain-containing protein [Desulfosporosinus orientis]AET66407.1 hypothetical protein Desor_0718 [Desulfosporosinus orientis DSM 765]